MSDPIKYPWTTAHQFEAFGKDGAVLCVVDAGPVRGLEDEVNSLKSKLYDIEKSLHEANGKLTQTESWLEDAKAQIAYDRELIDTANKRAEQANARANLLFSEKSGAEKELAEDDQKIDALNKELAAYEYFMGAERLESDSIQIGDQWRLHPTDPWQDVDPADVGKGFNRIYSFRRPKFSR